MGALEPMWQFSPLNGGQEYLTNSGGHNFRNDPIGKMVRESLQNSLDARLPDIGMPVIVDFTETAIDASHIGQESLAPHIASCYERTLTDAGAKRLAPFYKRAVEAVSAQEIRCLSVVDANTEGLKDGSWDALIRQEGAVIKANAPAAGGSFGVGKNAPFNLSSINTVIYATRFVTRRGRQEQMEGKSLLIPHSAPGQEQDGLSTLQHAGFYRLPDRRPVEGRQIPEPFRLHQYGTGVHIIGFDSGGRAWKTEAIRAVLHNFFYAVHHDKLVVNIKGFGDQAAITISSHTIEECFATYTEADDEYLQYYYATRSAPSHATEKRNPVGRLDVWVNQGGPRRTAIINRNGMLITDIPSDTRRNPLSPRNKAIWPDYTAVAMAADDATARYIRDMENPSHDEISVEWLDTERERAATVKALASIRRDIAEIIEEATGTAFYGETTNAEEMALYAPEKEASETGDGAGRVLDSRQITMSRRQTQVSTESPESIQLVQDEEGNLDIQRTRTNRESEETDEQEDNCGADAGEDSGSEQETGQPNQEGTQTGRPAKPLRVNARVIAGDAPDTAIVMLTPMGRNGQRVPVKIRLLPAGVEADKEDPVKVLEVSGIRPNGLKAATDGTHITFTASANQRIALRVCADRHLNNKAFHVTE